MNKDFELFKQYIIDNYTKMIEYRKEQKKEYIIEDESITTLYIKLEDNNKTITVYFEDEQEASPDNIYRTFTCFDSKNYNGLEDLKECFLDDINDCYGYDDIEEMLDNFNNDYDSDALDDTIAFIDEITTDFNKYKLNYELNNNLAIKTDYKNKSISKV